MSTSEQGYELQAEPPSSSSCGCPRMDGMIYHIHGTCTDPVVIKLELWAR